MFSIVYSIDFGAVVTIVVIDLKACESRGLLGTSMKVTPNLRGVPLERLSNVKFDKIVLCFVDCFPKAAEAVNGKMTD